MGKKNYLLWTTFFAVCVSAMGAMTSLAADKTVSSVSIRIDSKLEPGESLPSINYSNTGPVEVGDGDIGVSISSDRYEITDATWVTSTSRTMEVGSQPEMKVRLSPSWDYQFKGTYRASNVSVKSGTFVSASKSGGDLIVKLKVRAIKGTFRAPEDAYWKDNARGTARWEEPEEGGTGRYEVVLRKGSSKVHTVETTSRSYNFYPYMTQAGTYTFRVRTIAKTTKEGDYGKSSEWVESDEIYLAKEDVSDGSGRTDNNNSSNGPGTGSGPTGNTRVGWQYIGNSWYYYYPDGSWQKDGWAQVNGKWYLFQSDGRMVTGWQNRNNQTYYLANSGEMVVGWVNWNNHWYYMNPTQDAFVGCMLKNRWATVDGKVYYFGNDGAMAEGWMRVDGNWYYFYPGSGQKAVNTWINTFYVDANGVWKQ